MSNKASVWGLRPELQWDCALLEMATQDARRCEWDLEPTPLLWEAEAKRKATMVVAGGEGETRLHSLLV